MTFQVDKINTTPDEDFSNYGPDLSQFGDTAPLTVSLNADGETYTVVMPETYKDPNAMTKLAFVRRFNASERIAIRQSDSPIVGDFWELLMLAESVDITDPTTIGGINYLVSQGLLEQDRADAILG